MTWPVARGRRLLRGAVTALVLLAAGAGLGWAGAVVFRPAPAVAPGPSFTTAAVVPGEVGASLRLNATAAWTTTPAAANRATGTVTGVTLVDGQVAEAGTVLYTVDLRPVVLAAGAVPAFRELGPGARGEDVAQLQRLLQAAGAYRGPADGTLGAGTSAAVTAWQKSLGLPTADGVVRAGDVVFVPALPARLALNRDVIAPGYQLGGGEPAVSALPDQPSFTLSVTAAQAARMAAGTPAAITAPDDGGTWSAQVASAAAGPDQGVVVTLVPAAGGSICADACTAVAVGQQSLLETTVTTLAPVQGLTVPVAALRSDASGTVSVLDRAGVERPVSVRASSGGVAVVEGVAAGTAVRVPVPEADASPQADAG